jgi:DNA polymerase-3 subunit chi
LTEVSFYHLQRTGLEVALPKLLEKVLDRGMRAVVVAASDEHVAALDSALWTFGQDTFLPHGTAADGFAEAQPVFLTSDPAERPNRPQVLVLVDGVEGAPLDGIDRVLDMFDGGDNEAVAAARERWSALSVSGHDLTYWQQTVSGGWEERD